RAQPPPPPRRRRIQEALPGAAAALRVQPRQPAAHRRLLRRILGEDEVHELRHPRVRRRPRALVARDHHVHQHAHRLPLVRGEEGGGVAGPRRRLRGHGGARGLRGGLDRGGRELQRAGEGEGGQHPQRLAAGHLAHSAPFFTWSAMYSLVRIDSAMIVHVGFLSAWETNGPPSATKRLGTSCAWHCALSTEVRGSAPMRVHPSSWMMRPPVAIPYPSAALGIGEKTSPPISAISARKVSCMCFTCRCSWSLHFPWKRSTGIPPRATVLGASSQ